MDFPNPTLPPKHVLTTLRQPRRRRTGRSLPQLTPAAFDAIAERIVARRQRVLRLLRDPATRQCQRDLGRYFEDDGPVCLMGLLMRVQRQVGAYKAGTSVAARAAWIGLSTDAMWRLLVANDAGATFLELANAIEAEPIVTEEDCHAPSTPNHQTSSTCSSRHIPTFCADPAAAPKAAGQVDAPGAGAAGTRVGPRRQGGGGPYRGRSAGGIGSAAQRT